MYVPKQSKKKKKNWPMRSKHLGITDLKDVIAPLLSLRLSDRLVSHEHL